MYGFGTGFTWTMADKYEQEITNLKNLEEQPIIAFKRLLRWMLSDGAGALLLKNKPNPNDISKIEWMEAFSYAHELEACMYAGGDKMENGDIKPWSDYHPDDGAQRIGFGSSRMLKSSTNTSSLKALKAWVSQ